LPKECLQELQIEAKADIISIAKVVNSERFRWNAWTPTCGVLEAMFSK